MKVGAHYLGEGRCEFTVWAPKLNSVAVQILEPEKQVIPLTAQADGYWQTIVDNVYPGTSYLYQLNDAEAHPDPASYFQPQGVHGASQVIDHQFDWTDTNWTGLPLESMIFYELHVGTFTPEGTFAAIIPRLQDLRELGINAIELMPIAQFPGDDHAPPELSYRNWGYDGVFLFALQNSYGKPHELKQFVNACHEHGIAVVLDVVYNHFGPEGNYMSHFAPYFTETYRTPWGSAMNFDDFHSQGVRQYFIQNALYWLRDFRIDALRLDAVQAIYDLGAKHFLRELAEVVDILAAEDGRKRYLIAESDLNDAKIIRPFDQNGYGLDAQWSDDFHHALHSLLTGDRQGYYQDYGLPSQLAKAYTDTFIYDWKYAPHRGRFHGMPCTDRSPSQFVVCIQNHDQIGNQMKGERLWQKVSFEGLKLAAGAILLSPHLPLLFMGEEYGETAPFMYFVSHSDPELIKAVRAGRNQEFEAFHYDEEPPDPEAVDTFLACKLNWQLRQQDKHKILWQFYKRLIQLRQSYIVSKQVQRKNIKAIANDENQTILLQQGNDDEQILVLMNFYKSAVTLPVMVDRSGHKLLDSATEAWLGNGSQLPEVIHPSQPVTIQPESFAVYQL